MRVMFDCSRDGLSDRPNLMQNYWTKMQRENLQYVIWTYGLALILFGRGLMGFKWKISRQLAPSNGEQDWLKVQILWTT